MADKTELRKVPEFADLPDDQLDWFLGQSEEMHLKAGEIYSRQGDPADAMFVVLEGQLQGRGELGGEIFVFTLDPGRHHRHASVFADEAIHRHRTGGHRRPPSAIPSSQVSRSRAEDAGAGETAGRADVGSNPRSHAHGAAARPAGCAGKTFGWAGARAE